MNKKIFISILIGLTFIISTPVLAQEKLQDDPNTLNVYFFWGDGCPHCAKEEIWLANLEETNEKVDIYRFEIWKNQDNRELMKQVGKALNADVSSIPLTIVGDKYFTGYLSDDTTGKAIGAAVDECLKNKCSDPAGIALGLSSPTTEGENTPTNPETTVTKIKLPLVGEVDPMSFSLPLLTMIIGLLDGFNPCAMWALIFLISLLLGMENKRRMWILGSAFIAASGFMYFLFMSAWLNLLLFVGFIVWIRIIIGAVALGSGIYSIREYFVNKESVCKVSGGEKKQKLFQRLRNVVKQKSFFLALGGIILLASAVNLVELICSAGLPAIYTQVLTLSSIPTWQYYLYLFVYIFFYMIDDLFVFFVSMMTLQLSGITTKYTRVARLIGGILIFTLGILLIFKPAWLMFG